MVEKVKYRLAVPKKNCKRVNLERYPAAPYRNEFQRDRDRILYSKEFRRLSGKTQVFLSTSNDHIRTRLTHTLEVSQIARVTANFLGLNPALAESVALGHDVGHTPFGHVGERTLCHIMCNCDRLADFQEKMKKDDLGFKHNLQGLRVVCDLEQLYGKPGLNLSNYTLWGIKHHTKDYWGNCSFKKDEKCMLKKNPKSCNASNGLETDFYKKYFSHLKQDNNIDAWSFESLVVKQSDEIAQRHHDIEDALMVGLITKQELMEQIDNHFHMYFDDEDTSLFQQLNKSIADNRMFVPLASKFIVGLLNKKLIQDSASSLNGFIKDYNITSRDDFQNKYENFNLDEIENIIGYDKDFKIAENEFQDFLSNRILNSFEVQRMDGKGRYIIRRLFKAYITNPRQLHDSTIFYVFKLFNKAEKEWAEITKRDLGEMRNEVDSSKLKADPIFMIALLRGICDHIAGMTDSFAISEYQKLYG
jgi:dGTPase